MCIYAYVRKVLIKKVYYIGFFSSEGLRATKSKQNQGKERKNQQS